MKKKTRVLLLAMTILGALLAGGWWFGRELFEATPTHEALVATACDPGQTRQARGKAVCRLFADYVPPNADAATIHEVFGGCDWLGETRIYVYGPSSGDPLPLRVINDGEVFRFDFGSDYTIHGRFDRRVDSEEEVRRFFNPTIEPKSPLRLIEFAISDFPNRKVEVFGVASRHPPWYSLKK
jgi:hypothetical protein